MKVLFFVMVLSSSAFADQYVNGHVRKDGTYVNGYMRSDSNGTRNDNYSTKGNINPYTGSYGTKPRDDYGSFGSESSGSRRKKSGW